MHRTYEIRLLNGNGRVSVFYVAQCASDDDAKNHVRRMKGKCYARYELWCEGRMVDEGINPEEGAISR